MRISDVDILLFVFGIGRLTVNPHVVSIMFVEVAKTGQK